ncbi:cyclic nucleotide-binding domain-containing protein [Streptomyces tropicalis]|uniref:Cyclic nucleotide-binding domain-containing protein n=1 Tax=Streptomyces tropicalis TaxID=3034234 RepID=A0ABT6A3A0_9ACTN|nr:cyclic nucleotide-binding domain-containing protein [Streptomyces tropicalis]MDF3299128.1 cyclic nucleotide-binding domain-containing protein [Streptomyces tropicalis]
MTSTTTLAAALPAEHRARLLEAAHEVSFPVGSRLFEEGRHADRFWIVRSGTVTLDLHIPGRRAAVIESLGHGELVGWSWHFPPYVWQLGAEATSPVRAWEFDARTVRAMCADDAEFGRAVAVWVGRVVAHRLHSARIRLLDLYAPYGSGSRR